MSPEPALRVTGEADLPMSGPGPVVPLAVSEAASVRTLLWTAATNRPLGEVAALVDLLKRTGDFPNPGDEALRVAAVVRPVSEVKQLIALLNEHPHAPESGDEALRAAAVGRSVEEVVQLMGLLGRPDDDSPPAGLRDGQTDSSGFSRADADLVGADHLAAGADAASQGRVPPMAAPRGTADRGAVARARPTYEPDAPADWQHGHVQAPAQSLAGVAFAERVFARAAPTRVDDRADDRAEERAEERTEPQRAVGHPAEQPEHAVGEPLWSGLRWPAAAALAVTGLSHLPVSLPHVGAGRPADVVSLAITGLCLLLAFRLAARDTALLWAASAATAIGVMGLHAMSRVGLIDPLRSVLGEVVSWPGLVGVAFAVVSALCAGTVLLYREEEQERVGVTVRGM
ncbi:hypothetical protein [Streptomyces sp. H27-D2]|uniref:hypothetical protein n=1 Tax=Streptomyces sp. H27-D2 TaxID=3046304 RepID=UPI002DBBD503|nr:hypothetical protein [Streptomyces sp. H27-D2]MEC4018138.1 hypothetical protein [Streptomyces sp. H27-D2]